MFQFQRPRGLRLDAMRFATAIFGTIMIALAFSNDARAQCSSPVVGRWGPNTQAEAASDPGVIDISFTSCGDTNTQPNTSLGVKAWVLQSSGQWFGRPSVRGNFVNSQGKQWLLAKVPVGGYVDNMFMRNVNGDLQVFILHKSLDVKPDASVWYTYKRK
jgi:hypothetical protein